MKLKYAALINVAGIIFSSLSPALADTQAQRLLQSPNDSPSYNDMNNTNFPENDRRILH